MVERTGLWWKGNWNSSDANKTVITENFKQGYHKIVLYGLEKKGDKT